MDPARVARIVGWTRAQGILLDLALGAAVFAGVGRAVQRPLIFALAGALVGLLFARRWTRLHAAQAIERQLPPLGSALEALLEGQGGSLREPLAQWVGARTRPVLLRTELQRLVVLGIAFNLLGGLIAFAVARNQRSGNPIALTGAPGSPSGLSVHAHVAPPAYARQAPFDLDGPVIRALRGSVIALKVQAHAGSISSAEAGSEPSTLQLLNGSGSLSLTLDRSRTLRFTAGEQIRVLQLEAVPDAPPQVSLLEPKEDRVVTAEPAKILVHASARDDLAVASLAIRWTLSQGSGEATHFRNGAAAVHLSSSEEGKALEAEGAIDPKLLGMQRGDTLVIWAEATDNNALDGPGRGRSGARVVRWEEALVDMTQASDGVRAPPPPSKLSERELLARTQRLLAARMGVAEKKRAAALLADDQRSIRLGFSGLVESQTNTETRLDVDDKELGEMGDRRGQALLAEAVAAMWDAESSLSIGDVAHAVAPEKRAVKAIDAAFGFERYSLRSDTQDKPVSEANRLKGDAHDLHPQLPALQPAHPETASLAPLARTLLLAAHTPISRETARSLADALWALPAGSWLHSSELAAQLYAAADEASRSIAARNAGETLARALRSPPPALPPIDPREGLVISHLGPSARD